MIDKNRSELGRLAIIVPVYNVEDYLDDCLNSIASQNYENWDCFIINDGSKDSSLRIAESFKKKDKRFKIFTKDNGGLSSSRNYGLDEISKDGSYSYVGFVDGDDVIDPNMYSKLVSTIEQHQSDLAVCGIFNFNGEKRWCKKTEELGREQVITTEELMRLIFCSGHWAKRLCGGGHVPKMLLKERVVRNIRFIEDRNVVEDELFSVTVASKVSKTVVLAEPLYGYRRREGSLTGNERFLERHIKCREYCVPIAKDISEGAYLTTAAAYLNLLINESKIKNDSLRKCVLPILIQERIVKEGYLSKKQSFLYKLIREYPLLSSLIFKLRMKLK